MAQAARHPTSVGSQAATQACSGVMEALGLAVEVSVTVLVAAVSVAVVVTANVVVGSSWGAARAEARAVRAAMQRVVANFILMVVMGWRNTVWWTKSNGVEFVMKD